MPPEKPTPDPMTIEAWLSGDLSDVEAAELEAQLTECKDIVSGESLAEEDALLREVRTHSGPAPEIEELIDLVKTKHAPNLPAPREDEWRDVLTPSENPDILGMLGEYEVLEVIATGGMGILLKARDPELARIAALKVLSPQLATNATARERFLREARAAAKLEHGNILPIYGVHAEAVPYFAMRYVGGGSLQDAIDSGRQFSVEELKSITRQIAAALGSAHDSGFVHRDIKPGNILLDEDDEKVWVCDFGIAQSMEDPSLTYAGSIAGTPQYMSPEQTRGAELDGRSDLFSLGAVLYFCATGRQAFEGTTTASVMSSVTSAQPKSATQINAKLPKWFERLLANLLAKDKRDRPRDAAAVVRSIDDEHSPRPKHRVRRRRRLIACTVAILLIIGTLQIPAARNVASRAIASSFDRPYLIDGHLGAYSNLRDTINAAEDGDTLRLPAGELISVDNLFVPASKSLTLTSTQNGNPPILTTNIKGAPGIVSHSPIRLVGLDFRLNPKRDGDGIIKMHGALAQIVDCRFVSRRNVTAPFGDVKSRAIELLDGASAEISRCDFDLEETNAVSVGQGEGKSEAPSAVEIDNCTIKSFYALSVFNYSTPGHVIGFRVTDTDFTGRTFLKCSVQAAIPEITCNTERCGLHVTHPLCWFQTQNAKTVRKNFRWTGKKNSHSAGLARVQIGYRSSYRDAVEVHPISVFEQGVAPGHLRAGSGTIRVESTNKVYSNLQEAVDAVPDGDTLFLSGEINCPEIVYTEPGREVHFRAEPGKRPTIVAGDIKEHALFVRGTTSFIGIDFVRHDGSPSALPILGVYGAETAVVEDCQFIAYPALGAPSPGMGFATTHTAKTIVRRCTFHLPGGVAILLVDGSSKSDYTDPNLEAEECLIVAGECIRRFSRFENEGKIALRHCVAVCEMLFYESSKFDYRPIEFTVEGNLIDFTSYLSKTTYTPLPPLAENFIWSGKGNLRNSVGSVVAVMAEDRKSFVSRANFDNLPNATEVDGQVITPLFDRSNLRLPFTAASLKRALPDGLDSPALAALALDHRPPPPPVGKVIEGVIRKLNGKK